MSDIATLVSQMSDEELERAYKELVLDQHKKYHAQLFVWQRLIADEMWRRNHHQLIQDFRSKWKAKEKEYNCDTDRMYRENIVEMFDDILSMIEVTSKDEI